MVKGKVLVAGARGMVGGAIVRHLQKAGEEALLLPSSKELDLTQQSAVRKYMEEQRPSLVIVAAAKVGGIYANSTYPAEFLYENLMIEANLIHEAHQVGVEELLFLGSTCIYPRLAPQPMKESALLTGPLEETNEAYAIAKIAGIKLCQHYSSQYGRRYFSVMPTNLYGTGDNYHPENSHVIPALIRRFHEAMVAGANEVAVWGSGTPLREFLFVEDLAEACLFLLQQKERPSIVNVGSSVEVSIAELAQAVANTVGFTGKVMFDRSKPDGTPRKKSDTALIEKMGWQAKVGLEEGLKMAYADFLDSQTVRR